MILRTAKHYRDGGGVLRTYYPATKLGRWVNGRYNWYWGHVHSGWFVFLVGLSFGLCAGVLW